MKISITKAELLEIMSRHFGQKITQVAIAKDSSLHANLLAAMGKEMNIDGLTDQQVMTPVNKIPAIKALRTVISGLGLGEAKVAVEGWPRYIAVLKRKGGYPTVKLSPLEFS